MFARFFITAFAASCLLPVAGWGQATALDAAKVVFRLYGKGYQDRMVAVTGTQGGPQPREWHFFAYDLRNPGRISHFVVGGGKVTGAVLLDPARSRQWGAPVLPWATVAKDSDHVFKMANAAAVAARVGFNSLSYRLVTDEQRGRAVWDAELADVAGARVGSVRVDANTGAVLGQSWGGGGAPGVGRLDWDTIRREMKEAGRDIGNSFQQFTEDVGRRFSQ